MENSNYNPNESSVNSTAFGNDADPSTTCAAADKTRTANTPKLHNDGKTHGKVRQDIKNEQLTNNEEFNNEDEKKMAAVNFDAANLNDAKGQLPTVDQESHNTVKHGQSIDTNQDNNGDEKKLPAIVDFDTKTDHIDNDEEQAVPQPCEESLIGKVGATQTRTTNTASQSREEKRRSKRHERNAERQSTTNTASTNRDEKRIAKRLARNEDRQLRRPPPAMTSIGDDQVEEITSNAVTVVGAMARTPSLDISHGTDDFDVLTNSNEDDVNNESYSASEEGISEQESTDAPVLQAYMVQDEARQSLPEAEPMPYENIRRRNIIICFLFVVLSGIVAGISVFLTRQRSITRTGAPSAAPTLVPSSTPSATPTVSIEGLISLVSKMSVDGGESLRLTNSPQQRAFKWLKQNNTYIDLYTAEQILQRYALATFYFSTSGEDWITSDNWLSDDDECEWYPNGTLCPFGDNIISQIILPENNLYGFIPPEISFLAYNLTEIDFSGNKIFGSIPSTVGLLTNLVRLRLSENDLTGSIPPELGNTAKLEYLNLHLNRIAGSIPTTIGSLSKISFFDVTDTWTSGTLPTELGYLTDLEFLSFGRSFLSGSLVSEIGRLSQLRTLSLIYTGMSGTLPTEIGLLQNLKILDLRYNEIGGSLPTEIGNLSMLEILDLHDTVFGSTIPTEIGLLSKLTYWDFSDTGSLHGNIPSEIGNLIELQFLALGHDNLQGSLVSEIGELSKLRILHFFAIRFTGSIPSEIGRLTNLRSIQVINTSRERAFTGSIPHEITNLINLNDLSLPYSRITGTLLPGLFRLDSLERLDLSNNHISGSMPTKTVLPTSLQVLQLNKNDLLGTLSKDFFPNSSNIEILDLSNNNLSGTIPSEIGLLTNLRNLRLNRLIDFVDQFNSFEGTIPSNIGALTSLTNLDLSRCELSGQLPSEIGAMIRLEALYLSLNNLSGQLPSEIGTLSQLEWFELRENSIGGRIPSEIGTMTSLEWLDMNSNRFTGQLPSEVGMLRKLARLYLRDNLLEGSIPSELGLAINLYDIYLDNNILVGPIPSELGSLTKLGRFFIEGNDINGTFPVEVCDSYFKIDCDMVTCRNCDRCPCGYGDPDPYYNPYLQSETSSPTITALPTITPTHSVFPTLTPAPTAELIAVSIVIQFDYRPYSKQWSLSCNDTILQSVDYFEDFGQHVGQFANQRVEETFQITIGSICTFFISDFRMDGLCCEYGRGYYNILINNQVIVVGDGNFGSNDEVTFKVHDVPATDSPSLSPTVTIPPTITTEPTAIFAFVTIYIDSDEKRIGWKLECNNALIASVPVDAIFLETYDDFSTTLPVQNGALCNFTISDITETSRYQILIGDNLYGINSILIKDGFDFGSSDEYIFIA